MNKLTTAERIVNSILYGDPRGFGYSHPTGREKFEAQFKKPDVLNEHEGHDDTSIEISSNQF